MKKGTPIFQNYASDPKKPNFRLTMKHYSKTYCIIYGRSEEEVDARADEILDGLKLLTIQSNEELQLDTVDMLKRLIFEFDGMWELFDISGKEVPTAVQTMKKAKTLMRKLDKLMK